MAILKSLCLTVFSDRHCPMQHLLECHTDFDSSVTPDYITDCILSCTYNSEHFMSLGPSLDVKVYRGNQFTSVFYFILEYFTLPCMGYKIF